MKKIVFILFVSALAVSCGKDKATELCDCIDKNVSTKTTAEEASTELNNCTKNLNSAVKEMDGSEKAEFNKKVNGCLSESAAKNGIKMEFEVR
jgi:hypothetical protein